MNNVRRKLIIEAAELMRTAAASLELARDEEREAYENLPDAIMYSDRGDRMQDACDFLDEALEGLEMAIERAEDSML